MESTINTFKNLKSRQITEKKSMHEVKNFLLENGYLNVKNVGSQKLGWDFEAEKQLTKFFIEVKGIHNKQCKEIFFTKNELSKSCEKLDKYLIIIVTNVKSKNGKDIRVFSYDKKGKNWTCENEVLKPEPFYYKLKIENT